MVTIKAKQAVVQYLCALGLDEVSSVKNRRRMYSSWKDSLCPHKNSKLKYKRFLSGKHLVYEIPTDGLGRVRWSRLEVWLKRWSKHSSG